MNTNFEQDELDKMRNNPYNYRWGIFYFNPKDPRCLIPRKNGTGWSLNFANLYSYLIIVGVIIFAIIMGNIERIL